VKRVKASDGGRRDILRDVSIWRGVFYAEIELERPPGCTEQRSEW
jgi:hypothetical protein